MNNTIDLKDLIPDDNNFNKGTDEGRELVEQSLRKLGAGRSVLTDKNGNIIAGNKTVEGALNAGITRAIMVKTNGDQLVVVVREDLDISDLNSTTARELAFVDNRSAQVGLSWDIQELNEFIDTINPDDILGMDAGFLESLNSDNATSSDDMSENNGAQQLKCPHCGYEWIK